MHRVVFAVLRLDNDLNRKHQELEEFTYLVSHDLQKPLRHLTCFSSMLRRDLGDDLPEQAAKDLAFITGAAEHVNALVRDLLLLSRTGRAVLQLEDVPLDSCVDQALSMGCDQRSLVGSVLFSGFMATSLNPKPLRPSPP